MVPDVAHYEPSIATVRPSEVFHKTRLEAILAVEKPIQVGGQPGGHRNVLAVPCSAFKWHVSRDSEPLNPV